MEINNSNFSDWDKWKKNISNAVKLGETVGLSENTIENIGRKIGNILSAAIEPENREQRLLQELWRAGDDHDRKALSKMIVRMVETDDN